MKFEIENRTKYIYIEISGKSSLNYHIWKKIETARKDVVELIKTKSIYKVLIDCRELSIRLTTLDRFLPATFLVEENFKLMSAKLPIVKITVVADKSLIDPEKFGERVANNRGLHGLLTEDFQKAIDWLEIDQPV